MSSTYPVPLTPLGLKTVIILGEEIRYVILITRFYRYFLLHQYMCFIVLTYPQPENEELISIPIENI